jgi:hypothetical protein
MRGLSRAWWLAFLLPVLAVGLLAEPASSGGRKRYRVDPAGVPTAFKPGDTFRYAIWWNRGVWHIRTTTAGRQHEFKGMVVVEEGTIESVQPARLEGKNITVRDTWSINPSAKVFYFDFMTSRGVDGIDFTVSPEADRLILHLYIDGKHVPGRILIGRGNDNPMAALFTLPAHPR